MKMRCKLILVTYISLQQALYSGKEKRCLPFYLLGFCLLFQEQRTFQRGFKSIMSKIQLNVAAQQQVYGAFPLTLINVELANTPSALMSLFSSLIFKHPWSLLCDFLHQGFFLPGLCTLLASQVFQVLSDPAQVPQLPGWLPTLPLGFQAPSSLECFP